MQFKKFAITLLLAGSLNLSALYEGPGDNNSSITEKIICAAMALIWKAVTEKKKDARKKEIIRKTGEGMKKAGCTIL